MKKSTKIWIGISVFLIVVGIIVAVLGFSFGGNTTLHFNGRKFYIPNEVQQSETIELNNLGTFHSLNIDADYYDITFQKSDKNEVEIVYYDEEKKPQVKVINDTLTVSTKKKNDFLGFDFNFGMGVNTQTYQRKIIISYKDTSFDNIKINSDFNNIQLGSFDAKTLDLESNYSDITLDAGNFDDFLIDGDFTTYKISGIETKNLNYNGDYATGTFDGVLCDELTVGASFGEVRFLDTTVNKETQSNTSYTDVKISGKLSGSADFTADFGDVNLDLTGTDYGYDLKTDFGDCRVNGVSMGTKTNQNGTNMITASMDYCDITLTYR